MRKIFLIGFILFLSYTSKSQSQQSVWTAGYEARWYRIFDAGVKPKLSDDVKRKDLISYLINRLKSELPNGLESISTDSLNKLGVKIGLDYNRIHPIRDLGVIPGMVKWTPAAEEALRAGLLKDASPSNLEFYKKVCDCAIVKLKIMYPDSVMVPLSHDILQKVATECRDSIK